MYAQDRFERVHDFINFCESKPADEAYPYTDVCKCACAQFFGEQHDLSWFGRDNEIYANTGISLNTVAFGEGDKRDWRFGPLAKRVRAALAAKQGDGGTKAHDEPKVWVDEARELEEAF